MSRPRFGGMPVSPARPVPRVRFRSTVSRLSSCVCAVAIKAGECVKERIAELARSLFQRFMRLRRPRLHVAAARVQRHTERGAQLPDKGLVAVGFRAAQVMVEVRGLYPDAERVLQ